MTASCLYRGQVTHVRVRPVKHELRYRLFQIYLDLDEAATLDRSTRCFGFNRRALLSFHESDHGDGSARPLKAQIEALVGARGYAAGGPVRVLCMPRVLGYVFNPISIYFCHDGSGRLSAVVYEVNNTFGDRTCYVLSGDGGRGLAPKELHVSPFMEMDHDYEFHLDDPGARFRIAIHVKRQDEVWMTAAFAGDRSPFDDRSILALWLGDPLMTLKVVAGIHWDALKLWCKGLKLRSKPHGRVWITPQGRG